MTTGDSSEDDILLFRQGEFRPAVAGTAEELQRMLAALAKVDPSRLPEKARPAELRLEYTSPAKTRLAKIQKYISSFEYNLTGVNYFDVSKNRGNKRLASTAREIMRQCLPIKCIEAVFLAFYLTLGMQDLTRIPVRFMSKFKGATFLHIVMVVKSVEAKWGALGLSRKETLMFKALEYDTLSKLLEDFRDSYSALGHQVCHVGIGLPFTHDEHSTAKIQWKPFMLCFDQNTKGIWDQRANHAIDEFGNDLERIAAATSATGVLPEWFYQRCPVVRAWGDSNEDACDDEVSEREWGTAQRNQAKNNIRIPRPKCPGGVPPKNSRAIKK